MTLFEEENYNKKNFTTNPLSKGEYEYCIFEQCDFSAADLEEIKFISCEFIECNLSNANVRATSFQEVKFSHCKMLGIQFEACHDFNFSIFIDDCQLNDASFYQLKLNKSSFRNASLKNVDFSEADLQKIKLTNCNLQGCIFENTNLKGADLRLSVNFNIDPTLNKINGAKFSRESILGLLTKYQIIVD